MTRAEWAKRPGRSSSFVRRSLRFAVYARDQFDCVYCRGVFPIPMDGKGLTLEHVVPRSRGGSNSPENLITACTRCNFSRGNRAEALPKTVAARVLRAVKKPINRELGQWLARMARSKACATSKPRS